MLLCSFARDRDVYSWVSNTLCWSDVVENFWPSLERFAFPHQQQEAVV